MIILVYLFTGSTGNPQALLASSTPSQKSSLIQMCSVQQRANYLRAAREQAYGASVIAKSLSDSQLSQLFKENVLVDDKHEVMFCYVAKAGSTSYKSILIELSELYQKTYGNTSVMSQVTAVRDIHDESFMKKYGIRRMSRYSNEEKRKILANYFKVMAVRHPLDRLYSMYVNKLRQEPAKHAPDYQRTFGKPIALEMRPKNQTRKPKQSHRYNIQRVCNIFL